MTSLILNNFEKWFDEFVEHYSLKEPEYHQNIELKIAHTYRVKEAMSKIVSTLDVSENDRLLALTMALFHDVGRFPQYHQYKTFKDSSSENHASLSIKTLKEHKVLNELSKEEADLVNVAIINHNKAEIPTKVQGRQRFFAQLLRDADKVDILYTVTNFYENSKEEDNKSIALDLEINDELSDKVLETFLNGETILYDDMKVANDFKLLQLAWVHDLNFDRSLELIIEGNYFQKIINTLPKGEKQDKVKAYMANIINKKMIST